MFNPLRLVEGKGGHHANDDAEQKYLDFAQNAINAKRFVKEFSEPHKWNNTAKETGELIHVECDWLKDWSSNRLPATLKNIFWHLLRHTPYLTLLLVIENPAERLPTDWGNGFKNVALGVQVQNRQQALARIEMLRKTPAAFRYLEICSFDDDLGEINLEGIELLKLDNTKKFSRKQKLWHERFTAQFDAMRKMNLFGTIPRRLLRDNYQPTLR